MIIDSLNEYSDAQTVTGTPGISTNVLDHGAAGETIGEELYLHIFCDEAAEADGLATVTFSLETDDVDSFVGATTLWSSAAIGKASLLAGTTVTRVRMPKGRERFTRVRYAVTTGPLTAGKFSAFLSPSVQDHSTTPAT